MQLLRPRLLLFLCAGLAVLGGCRETVVDARWRTCVVTLDGQDTEWADARVETPSARVGLGLMCDSTSLYVAVRLADAAAQRQVMMGGLTVWLDPKGGKGKTYGLRFPVRDAAGFPRQQGPAFGGASDSEAPPEAGAFGARPGPAQMEERMKALLQDSRLQILGPLAGQRREVALPGDDQLQVAASYDRGALVCEVRVALASLAATPGGKVGLGFETHQPEMGSLPQRGGPRGMGGGPGGMGGGPGGMGGGPGGMGGGPGGMGGGPGGMGGGPGGMGGGPGGMGGGPGGMRGPGGMGASQERTLKVWAQVHLAAGAPSEQP